MGDRLGARYVDVTFTIAEADASTIRRVIRMERPDAMELSRARRLGAVGFWRFPAADGTAADAIPLHEIAEIWWDDPDGPSP